MRRKNAKLCDNYALKIKRKLCKTTVKSTKNQGVFHPFLVPKFLNWIVCQKTSFYKLNTRTAILSQLY